MKLSERLMADGPKRILALDGGGIRGALELGYLGEIEKILRARHQRPKLLLCDYFDFIGGTSTGAIIAAALAIGKEVDQIKDLYERLGDKVFTKHKWYRWGRWWRATFDAGHLRTELNNLFGDLTLGHREEDPLIKGDVTTFIRTGLCIVTKRAEKGSTWPLFNNPKAKYYERNKGILLRKLVRASTAAPVYFEEEHLDVGGGEHGMFVDGGLSMANNPALQLFLMATLKGFNLHWPTGENNLLIVSIGTGAWRAQEDLDAVTGASKLSWAKRAPSVLMNDANLQNQVILQYLSRSATPWEIDREIGNMANDCLTPEPLLTYLRYNVKLDENDLNSLGLSDMALKLKSLRMMEIGSNVRDLIKITECAAAAERSKIEQHIPSAFNLPTT